jgi:hypothetical protein
MLSYLKKYNSLISTLNFIYQFLTNPKTWFQKFMYSFAFNEVKAKTCP